MSESNNSGFEIERSNVTIQNSDLWSNIGLQMVRYNYWTEAIFFHKTKSANCKYKYRLKQIDLNGNFEYFQNRPKWILAFRINLIFHRIIWIRSIRFKRLIIISWWRNCLRLKFMTLSEEKKDTCEWNAQLVYKLQFNASDLSSEYILHRMIMENIILWRSLLWWNKFVMASNIISFT